MRGEERYSVNLILTAKSVFQISLIRSATSPLSCLLSCVLFSRQKPALHCIVSPWIDPQRISVSE